MKPIVKWAQDYQNIFIRIDTIPDINDSISLENNTLIFQRNNKYDLQIKLSNDVNKMTIIKTHYYQFTIEKNNQKIFWNNLTNEDKNSTKHWLKIDWEKWVDQEEKTFSFDIENEKKSDADDAASDDITIHSSDSESE